MKASNYNFFFPYAHDENKYIAYNSLSNSLALIDSEKYKQYLSFEKNGLQIGDKNIYCYEKNAINNCYMNEETENNIVKMLEQRVSRINNFYVTWYGGEPLIAIDTIKRLSEKFIKLSL